MATQDEKRVSVVIPSKNEGTWIAATVEGIIQAGGPLLREVIVVDDGSDDDSCSGLAGMRSGIAVHVRRTSGIGVAPARNLGSETATGDVVVFMDAHCAPDPGWLEELCEVIDMGHASAIPLISMFDEAGNVVENGEILGRFYVPGAVPWEVSHWFASKGEAAPLGHGTCQAFKLETFHEIGGFCNLLAPFGGEDGEIGWRIWSLGLTIGAAPGARIWALTKNWDGRPDRHEIVTITWANLVRPAVLHWGARRLIDMWDAIDDAWGESFPELLEDVFDLCHEPEILALRRVYRKQALVSDDEIFAMFQDAESHDRRALASILQAKERDAGIQG